MVGVELQSTFGHAPEFRAPRQRRLTLLAQFHSRDLLLSYQPAILNWADAIGLTLPQPPTRVFLSTMGNTAKSHSSETSKIFIVDDHPVFREGLSQLVGSEEDLEVCGSAGSFGEALEGLANCKPDLVLVDITLPDKSGLELIKAIRTKDRKVKLLVVSMHDEALYANRVLRIGGDGYIMKQEGPAEIINAIHDVLEGHIYVSEEVMVGAGKAPAPKPIKQPVRLLDALSDSELEILELLGRGQSNEEISQQLRLSVETVDAECLEIRKKLNLKSDNALVRYAVCWVETGAA
ncbi:MAG TPA: response regulator transcription factor [Clostridia bacterium]|nr:response regulator transcription factor [Clostridia bacterium]